MVPMIPAERLVSAQFGLSGDSKFEVFFHPKSGGSVLIPVNRHLIIYSRKWQTDIRLATPSRRAGNFLE